ncbi:zinc finger, CCHC-type containing protein [Tanacetum coccineum]
MTTTVVNNLVFRSFFEKQKLTGPNFMYWYRNLQIMLSVEDRLPFLEQPIPAMPVPPAGQVLPSNVLNTHSAWVKASKEITGLMLMTMEPDIQNNLEQLGTYDMLKELKTLYAQQAEHELLQTVREFHACKHEEGYLILVSLRKEYDSFMQNYNMHCIGKTVTELHAKLKLHEQTLPPKDVAPALHAIRAGRVQKNQKKKPHKAAKGNQGKAKMGYAHVPAPPFAPKPKNPPTPKKDNPVKDAICHQCGEVGHWRKNCLVYLVELLKKKKLSQGASTSGIFTIELYSFPSTSWVYDTGCGTHICITTQGLRGSRKLKPGALSLYVGDGHRASVEAIGEFHLCLPSGLLLILHNCHYASSITRGIISVSCLYMDSFFNRFENDNTILVSRNNLVYFSAIPQDDIYEIDLSSSNTNDISMYAIRNKRAKLNLDSTLLWYCHLGHISKKRIEKLQHDALLNSTEIKSFEKCVSCMSGKMARKPYSHQVERAKDLLGLIHIDSFWDYTLESAARILNMVPTKKVDKIPYEVWHRQAPKLIPKGNNGIFILLPTREKVFVARNAEFFENSLITQEASGSLEDLEIIQEEDTHPSIDTSLNHEKNDQEIDEPQSDINPIPELLDPESDKWLDAMNVKMQSMKDNEVWDLVDLPPNGKTVGSKWLFKKKTDMDGSSTINMYCDSIGAIAIAKDHGITKGARHFRAKVHYLRETIEMGDVRIEKVDTDDNLADPFTKALAFHKHSELTRKIGMIPASSLM